MSLDHCGGSSAHLKIRTYNLALSRPTTVSILEHVQIQDTESAMQTAGPRLS